MPTKVLRRCLPRTPATLQVHSLCQTLQMPDRKRGSVVECPTIFLGLQWERIAIRSRIQGTSRFRELPEFDRSMTSDPRMTAPKMVRQKYLNKRIAMVTAYDYPQAKLADEAGVDGILVGDSLAMVVQGRENTLPATLDELIYHAEMVGRATNRAMVVVDLPFPINHLDPAQVIRDASRVLKETRCQAVKLEGGQEQASVIDSLVTAGIPVMAHVGLRPQTVHQMGGYRVQRDGDILMADAVAAEQAGAFAVVVECVASDLAAAMTDKLKIPTIGIGAGAGCDGQVLVLHDLIGMTSGYVPSFVKQFADVGETIRSAIGDYCREVRDGTFPSDEHGFS